jgi:hypothetical protein
MENRLQKAIFKGKSIKKSMAVSCIRNNFALIYIIGNEYKEKQVNFR